MPTLAHRFSHHLTEGHALGLRRAVWHWLGLRVVLTVILAFATPAPAKDAATAFSYEVAIEVIDAPSIAEIFKRSSLLLELVERPPSSERGLRRRIDIGEGILKLFLKLHLEVDVESHVDRFDGTVGFDGEASSRRQQAQAGQQEHGSFHGIHG